MTHFSDKVAAAPRDHHIGSWACSLLALVMLAAVRPAEALIYTYENTTSGPVNETATPCTNPLIRTFTVSESFTVASIALGLNVTHTYRGDLRGTLVAPSGASFQFVSERADRDNNYDILISTNAEGSIDDGDADPVAEPYYNRLVSNAGMDFYTSDANGTWTLQLCDALNLDSGTFNRARLVLESSAAATISATSTLTYDWGTNGNGNAFSNITVGGVTLSQASATDFGGAGRQNPGLGLYNFRTSTGVQGAHTGYYSFYMDASAIGSNLDSELVGEQVTFGFDIPVRDLGFDLLDVDFASGDFEDLARVQGLDSKGDPVPYTLTVSSANQQAGDWGEGDTSVASSSSDANLSFRFDGAVSSIRVDYGQSNEPAANAGDQAIGLSDFTFVAFDYGDAPDGYGTLLASDGARHVLGSRALYLGANPPDGESDGAPGTAATTDDSTQVAGVDDEDGVASFPTASTPDGQYTVGVTYGNDTGTNAQLCGWIDFDQGGTFDAEERVCATVSPGASSANLVFTVPSADRNRTGDFYARFRISTDTAALSSPGGIASDGEVEDYRITGVTSLPITLASVHARSAAEGLAVEWTTATETRNAGFHLYGRLHGEQRWLKLTERLVPSRVIDSLEPQRYQASFPGVVVDELLLEDWDTRGQTERHGPFSVGPQHGFDAVTDSSPIDWRAIRAENRRVHSRRATARRPGAFAAAPESSSQQASLRTAIVAIGDALLWVEEPGIQRISLEALRAAGAEFEGVPVDQVALTDNGKARARHVIDANGNGVFDVGDHIEFLGLITPTLYSGRNAYRLQVDPSGSLVKTAKSRTLHGNRAAPAVLAGLATFEQDRAYSFATPTDDPWYDQWLFAYGSSASLERTFDLPGYAGGEATLQLDLWGVTDWPGDIDDHHLIVTINDMRIDDAWFDGSSDASRVLAVPDGVLDETGNRLVLEAPGDTGYDYDIQAFDGFSVTYERHTTAHQGLWRGQVPPGMGSKILLTGFEGESVAWKGAQRRVGNAELIIKGRGAWAAADARAIHEPRVQVDIPAPAEHSAPRAVDYLLITHPDFVGTSAMADLVALQQARGLSTVVVDVDRLYAAYSDFEVDPEAIRRYLRAARPRYVLLVGGDSYDYRDRLDLASQSFVPTHYQATGKLISQTPADSHHVDFNGNGIPQARLGRLPVRTTSELDQLVAKLVAYAPPAGVVLAAGPSDTNREFARTSDAYAARLPTDIPAWQIYADDLGLPDATHALIDELGFAGTLVSYVGHSSYSLWGLNPSQGILLRAGDARGLVNGSPHVVTQWGCWNTYFVDPRQDTMANAFLFNDHGASVVLGATALTDLDLLQRLGEAFFDQVGQQISIGDALFAAQRQVARAYPDSAFDLRGFALLGDPAAELQ